MFESVKANMISMLQYSKIEKDKYMDTGEIIYLQQAGEKLFNALENYIQYINKVRAESFFEIKKLIVQDKPLRKLLYDARTLHRYFYNRELELEEEDAVDLYDSVYGRLKKRIERI